MHDFWIWGTIGTPGKIFENVSFIKFNLLETEKFETLGKDGPQNEKYVLACQKRWALTIVKRREINMG